MPHILRHSTTRPHFLMGGVHILQGGVASEPDKAKVDIH